LALVHIRCTVKSLEQAGQFRLRYAYPLVADRNTNRSIGSFDLDSHLAACVACGLTGLEANLLTELRVGWEPQTYAASRGWSPEAMDAATAVLTTRGLIDDGALTAEGTALRDGIEETTDRLLGPVVDAIGDDLPGLLKMLDGWSQQIVDRGWFPPDPYKRASG